jgi:hypothetical protein
MCLITSELFTIEQDAIVIWVVLVPRRLNVPQFEARVCQSLRGKFTLCILNFPFQF